MNNFAFTLTADGDASANTAATEKELKRLANRFKTLIPAALAPCLDKLIFLAQSLQDLEAGLMTELGWYETLELFNWIDAFMIEHTGLIELDTPTFNMLQEIHKERQRQDPDITIEQVFNQIILATPIPVDDIDTSRKEVQNA